MMISPHRYPYHIELLDIVFGKVNIPTVNGDESLPYEIVDVRALEQMKRLVKIEFNAAFEKEISNDEEDNSRCENPNVWDVYLVEPSYRNKNIHIAVTVPTGSRNKNQEFELRWLDENGIFWDIEEITPVRKVSSLSGTARVLENLDTSGELPYLMESAMQRTDIFDVSIMEAPSSTSTIANSLNKSQNLAMSAIQSESFQSGFFVIQGPPGTGKSTTLVHMICETRDKVIVSAPSNAAVASLALKLFSNVTKNIDHSQLCVYGQNCNEDVKFLNPTIRKERYQKLLRALAEEQDARKASLKKRNFSSWLNIDPDSTLDDISAICSIEDGTAFSSSDIICCTLNSSGSKWLRKYSGDRGSFFLDEAGQCNEAEFYLATTFPGLRRIVVVGDPRQLPPTVIDLGCKEAGLGISWMEKVYNLHSQKVHLLDTQYRMDPLILKFPNQEFYGNRIQSGEIINNRTPRTIKAVSFVDTSNRSWEERENFSIRNAEEAIIIRALLRQDDDIQKLLQQQQVMKVAVITPYRAQSDLLRKELKKVKDLKDWSVSTVDSYQGQEADIVIISTVRTERVGFIDDPQRLNVALTRAKRILRIVGCKNLFESLGRSSTLKKLISFHCSEKQTSTVTVKNVIFSFPDWRKPSLWKPLLTQRFHNCLKSKKFSNKEQAILLTTLQAVTKPNPHVLYTNCAKEVWNISCLRGQQKYSVVWVAKGNLSIEAHFGGTREVCLNFVQKIKSIPPVGSCKVKPELDGIEGPIQPESGTVITPSWELDNPIQRAIENDEIDQLPEGCFQLDEEQQAIVSLRPPILLESRSGTGKTNVLFQHAVNTSKELSETVKSKPLAFITVSKLLVKNLKKMFNDNKQTNKAAIKSCDFMSLSELLDILGNHLSLEMKVDDTVTFREFLLQKKSHSVLPKGIDLALIENEIGGVISGSLQSAEQRRALSWEQYRHHKRSNVTHKGSTGTATRRQIYDHYESYLCWKVNNKRFDVNDIILEILRRIGKERGELFSGIYLDEVQDFSYATIYLICSLGGSLEARWVFAGDTAQMISPGCSFKFSGLKETLLSVKPGIESRLKNVSHLLKNYRTTKDVLLVGNAILGKAKEFFPGAIEVAKEEVAQKDLGLRVVLHDWDTVMTTKPSFGGNQALVYSFSEPDAQNLKSMIAWLDNHPFILNVIDSKGLEFDDIVVAFDLDRNCWKVESQELAALKMLRELYVAVTRAKRRVVILVKKKNSDTMKAFLSSLTYQFEYDSDTDMLFQEFNTSTTAHDWIKRANELFSEERYDVASRCYERGKRPGFASWAHGKYYMKQSDKIKANEYLIKASILFHNESNHKRVLDVASDLIRNVSWDEMQPQFAIEKYYDEAESKHPSYLKSTVKLRIDIFRDRWDRVHLNDLEINAMIVDKRRNFPGLLSLLRNFNPSEIKILETSIPNAIGDACLAQGKLLEAIPLYFVGGDLKQAEKVSVQWIELKKYEAPAELLKLTKLWEIKHCHLPKRSILITLFGLLDDPEKAAMRYASKCLESFGKAAIMFTLEHKELSPTLLHYFCKKTFYEDVLQELKKSYEHDLGQIVEWFLTRNDNESALKFICDRFSLWETTDLESFFRKGLLRLEICNEIFGRKLFFKSIGLFLECGDTEKAFEAASRSVSSIKDAEQNAFKVNHLLKDKRLPPNKKMPARILVLRKLACCPQEMKKIDCKYAIENFGPDVIQNFILRGAPFYEKDEKYIDILNLLKRFGTKAVLSPKGILQKLEQKKIRSEEFVAFHFNKWTLKDLCDIKRFGYRNTRLGDGFLRYGKFVMAAEQFLLEKLYTKAIDASNRAISTKELAVKNASDIIEVWLTKNNSSILFERLQQQELWSSKVGLLLECYQCPIRVVESQSLLLSCREYFPVPVIVDAVISCYLTSPQQFQSQNIVDVLNKFWWSHGIINHVDVLRWIHERSEERSIATKSYAKDNSSCWQQYGPILKNEDIVLLLDLEEECDFGIDAMLEERQMFTYAIDYYIKRGEVDVAIDYSNAALGHPVSKEKIRHIVELWRKELRSKNVHTSRHKIHENTKLCLLLKLFDDPRSITNANFKHQCLSYFGRDVVEIAVLKKFPKASIQGDIFRFFDQNSGRDRKMKQRSKQGPSRK